MLRRGITFFAADVQQQLDKGDDSISEGAQGRKENIGEDSIRQSNENKAEIASKQ